MPANDIIVFNKVPYRVSIVDLGKPEIGEDMKFGYYEYSSSSIGLTKWGNEWVRWETLIHELVHLVNDAYLAGLDEQAVSRISNGISGLLAENIDVLKSYIPKDIQ